MTNKYCSITKMDRNFKKYIFCLFIVCYVDCYKDFVARIPNGERVPSPCVANTLWKAAGHQHILGAGHRNPFGKDFEAAGWVRIFICRCSGQSTLKHTLPKVLSSQHRFFC